MGPLTRAGALAIALLCLTAAPAAAQGVSHTFMVTSQTDAGDNSLGDGACSATLPGVGGCTLRAAIQEANQTAQPDTIVLPAGTYGLTVGPSGEDAAAGGDLDIVFPLTINGAGARSTIVEQQTVVDRVFDVRSTAGNVTLQGLTVRAGSLPVGGGQNGAGIQNAGNLTVADAAVRDSEGNSTTAGGGIFTNNVLTVERSLISGNFAGATGGGISNNSISAVVVRNSTFDGNTSANGSAYADTNPTGSNTQIDYSTIANNNTTGGAANGAVARTTTSGATRLNASIIASNPGGSGCSQPAGGFVTQGHNIEQGKSCSFFDPAQGDKLETDPLLAALAFSSASDQTETRAPQAGSPAIDGGATAGCPTVDQRGLPRPSGATCDTGAFEVQQAIAPPPPPPKPASIALDPPSANRTPGDANTVTATVRNDNGTPAAGQSVRYAISGPNATAGAVTTDASGVARISWDGVHEGTDNLSAFVDSNGNFSTDPGEPAGQASVVWKLPEPKQGKTANIEPVSGTVRITVKPSKGSKIGAAGSTTQVLTEAKQVPLSTVVDVRRGRVRMTTEANKAGDVQKGEFYGGVYTTTQSSSSSRPVTELRMSESLICQKSSKRGKLTAARARSRHLWGSGKGRYRTRGRYSTATVRGTIWLQKDSCNTTTTVVRQGVVVVKDLVKRKNVRVKAGKRYTARKSTRRRR